MDSSNNNIYLNTVQGSLNGIFTDAQSHNNSVTFNNLKQDTQIDINNANGLPTNINNNGYDQNACNVSLPNGLCYGVDQPNHTSNIPEVEPIEQPEIGDQSQNGQKSTNPINVESDEHHLNSQDTIGSPFNSLGSGNNVAVQSQDNGGSISAGQDSSGSSDGSSDSNGSETSDIADIINTVIGTQTNSISNI